MAHTYQEQVNDGWPVNKNRKRGVGADGDHMEFRDQIMVGWDFSTS